MRTFTLSCLALGLAFSLSAQEYLGWDTKPLASDSIQDLPYLGNEGDFSGGVQIGEQCPDIQMYNLNGESVRIYDELRADRYTILFSLSMTCDRVQDGLDPEQQTGILDFYNLHGSNFNWIPIYTDEAHPADPDNCPSNCPGQPTLSLDGDTIWSHVTYQDRAVQAADILNFSNSPSYSFTYPFENLWLDNPDNGALVEIFQAPFSIVVLDCAGYVLKKYPFMNIYLNNTDNWEFLLNLADQPDTDQDGVCNMREFDLGTDPLDPCDPYGADTDGDGECDLSEELNGTDMFDPCDPIFVDMDGDGICDFEDDEIELPPCVEDPTDSDQDGYCDAEEVINGSDPFDPCSPNDTDTDQDGICNAQEELDGTNPYDVCDPDNTDSDGDGFCDLEELTMEDGDPFDPCLPESFDSDGDGICNLQEIQDGSNPADPCDPDNTDTDGDGICDNQEIIDGTDPFVDESVGISELAGIADLKVFPNPMGSQLQIRSSSMLLTAQLYSADGRLVRNWNLSDIASGLDVSSLAQGSYTLQVVTADLRMQTVQLIK